MKLPRALLFDLNNTLLDLRALPGTVAPTCADLAFRLGLDAALLAARNQDAWQRHWPVSESDWTLGRLTSETLSRRIWREALVACGCDDETTVRLAAELHAGHASRAVTLFEDARESVDRLRSRLVLGIVSNGDAADQRRRLRSLGLEHHFGAVVISAEVGVAKPDPVIFQVALDRLGVRAEETWHVGDSLAGDVAGAQAAGLTAVWLNRAAAAPGNAPVPDIEVTSLCALADHVAGLARP